MEALEDEMPLATAEAAGERRSASPDFMVEERPPRDEHIALEKAESGSDDAIDLTESADIEDLEDQDVEADPAAGRNAGGLNGAANSASQKSAKRRAAGADSAPSEDAGNAPSISGASASASDSTAPAAKKRRFAAVKKSEKCGKCDNCLNPHWKKPCIEVRKFQEAPSAPAPAVEKKKPTPATIEATSISNSKPSAASSAAFVESLGKIMSPGAGIMHTHHVPVLIDLMKRASNWAQRTSLLHAVVRSPSDVQSEMVYQKGLLILQKWLGEAIEAKRSTSLQNLLNALDAVPMTLAALQPPCELGRMVGKLKKAAGVDEGIHNHAKILVTKWKAIVAQGDAGSLAQPAAVAASAAAKASSAAAETKAAVAKAATTSETKALKKPPPQKVSLSTPSASSGLSLGDGDIFGAADKKRADAAVAREKQQHEGPTSSTSATSASAANANAKPASGAPAKKATSEPTTPSRSTSFSLLSATSSKFSAPPPMLTGADRARQRAKEAAARVPSPPPEPRKEKRKKVSWVNGNELEAVRWFRRTDPPLAAQNDVDDSVAEAAVEPPPRFASAAKKEHLSEAVALRQHREQEEHEEAEFVERLSHMKVDIQWYDPPIIAAAENASLQVAKGEQSEEAMSAARRRAGHAMRPVVYPTPEFIPPTPVEPLDPADRGPSAGGRQPLNIIHRIPLSLEEARAWHYAPPPHVQQQVPPPGRYYHQPQPVPPPAPQPMYSQHHHPLPPSQHAPAYPGISAPASYGGVPGYGAPPPGAPAPIPRTSATAARPVPLVGGLPALPDGLGAALSQLAASGALNNLTAPHQQHYQVPDQGEVEEQKCVQAREPRSDEKRKDWMRQYMEKQRLKQEREKLQQQQQKPRQQHQGPRLPPSLRPMLGLHGRPQQQQQQQPATMHVQGPQQQQQGGGGFLKTVPCRFFNSPAGCRHGDRCKFSHTLSATNVSPQ